MKVVAKANNDLISFCDCSHPLATQGQLDCPWCGCGWLFTCSECRRAFTYGEVVESDLGPDMIGRSLVSKRGGAVAPEHAAAAIEWLEYEMQPLSIGDVVGHEFTRLPHRDAQTRSDLDSVFGSRSYWLERELRERRP